MATAEALQPTRAAGGLSPAARRVRPWLFILPALAVTVVFLVVPLGYLLVMSVTQGSSFLTGTTAYTLDNFRTIFFDQFKMVRGTVFQAVGSTLIDLVFGFPFARTRSR